MTSFIIVLAACRVERESEVPAGASAPSATTLTFGQAGGSDGLTPAPDLADEPTGTVTDTGTADEPTEPDTITTVEDTGTIVDVEPLGCDIDESLVTIIYTAPEGATEVSLSGMLEATHGDFPWCTIQTDVPAGMQVTTSNTSVVAEYTVCVPDDSRWELSASYKDASGATRYSCEGENLTENGSFEVWADDVYQIVSPEPIPNGYDGCDHQFWIY